MNQNRLTETNLQELDEKIQHEKFNQDKKAAILEQRKAEQLDRASVKSRPSTAKPPPGDNLDDLKSQKSFASRASRKSNAPDPRFIKRKNDGDSEITASVKGKQTSDDSDVDEEDEWAAI